MPIVAAQSSASWTPPTVSWSLSASSSTPAACAAFTTCAGVSAPSERSECDCKSKLGAAAVAVIASGSRAAWRRFPRPLEKKRSATSIVIPCSRSARSPSVIAARSGSPARETSARWSLSSDLLSSSRPISVSSSTEPAVAGHSSSRGWPEPKALCIPTRLAEPPGGWHSSRTRARSGASRARTDDLCHAMAALSQLSYSPVKSGQPKGSTWGIRQGRIPLGDLAEPNPPVAARCLGRGDEFRHVHFVLNVAGSAAAAPRALNRRGGREAGGRCVARPWRADRRTRGAVGIIERRHHAGVDQLHVLQQALGVGAQRVSHLTQVAHQLQTLGTDAVGGGAGVEQQLSGTALGIPAGGPGGRPGLLDGGVGVLLGVGDDRQSLAGGGGLGLLELSLAVAPQPGCLLLRRLDDLDRLLLGGLHPILRGALSLGDPLVHPLLGLRAHGLRRVLGGLDDRRHVLCGGTRARSAWGWFLGHGAMVKRRRQADRKNCVVIRRWRIRAGHPAASTCRSFSDGPLSNLTAAMSPRRYEPRQIEPKWQDLWARERTWEVSNEPDGDEGRTLGQSYGMATLPYPSGEPHIGHLKNYALGDAIAHFHRRTGRRVLHPMGYDAFGLPAENNAIKTGVHPRVATDRSIAAYRHWFHRWGISIDWSRELGTHEPSYYRWTQWIFLQLLERGLAYRKEAAVKWCPNDATVLANEQVIDRSEE